MNSTLRHESKYKSKFNLDIFRKENLISCFHSVVKNFSCINCNCRCRTDIDEAFIYAVPVKEVVECFNTCKAAMERRGLKINNGKMKILVSKNEIL